jgi:hypothetical protein
VRSIVCSQPGGGAWIKQSKLLLFLLWFALLAARLCVAPRRVFAPAGESLFLRGQKK